MKYAAPIQSFRCSDSNTTFLLMRVRQIFVSLFVRPHGTTYLSLENFHEISIRVI